MAAVSGWVGNIIMAAVANPRGQMSVKGTRRSVL